MMDRMSLTQSFSPPGRHTTEADWFTLPEGQSETQLAASLVSKFSL